MTLCIRENLQEVFLHAKTTVAPRPRTTVMLSDPFFIRTKAQTLEIFQREVRK